MDCIKKNVFFWSLLLFTFSAVSQQISTSLSNGINSSDKEIVEVFQLWKDYLSSNPDKLYDNPYWNYEEKKRYPSYDLLKSEGFLNPSLYALQPKNKVLYIKKMEDYYLINSIYYWIRQEHEITPLAITNVLAKKNKEGSFRLFNYLPKYTETWTTQGKGYIKYHFAKDYRWNAQKAEEANYYLQHLFELFDIEPTSIDYYIAKDCDEIHELKGFQFIMSMGKIPNLCAFFDDINKIVYTTRFSGEFHRHELIHIINTKYDCAHPILLSGLSVYTDSENSLLGKPFLYHMKKIQDMINEDPSIRLTDWNNIEHDFETEPYYFIGAVLIDILLEKGEVDLLIKALEFGSDDEDIFNFFHVYLNIPKKQLETLLKDRFKEISAQKSMDFKIDL